MSVIFSVWKLPCKNKPINSKLPLNVRNIRMCFLRDEVVLKVMSLDMTDRVMKKIPSFQGASTLLMSPQRARNDGRRREKCSPTLRVSLACGLRRNFMQLPLPQCG